MAADDLPNIPAGQGFPDLDPSSSVSGNRPASGARRATPGEVLSQGFQGAQNAGDFLGLDTEFAASQDPNQVFGAGSPLDLVQPPSTFVDDGSQAGYAGAVPEPAPMPDGDAAQEFAQAPSAFEFGEDLGSEEGEAAEGELSAPSRKPVLVGTLLVAALVGGGVFYGPQLYSRYFGSATEVAVVPPSADPGPAPAHTESPVATTGAKPVAEPLDGVRDPAPETKPSGDVTGSPEPRKPILAPRATSTSPLATPGKRSSEPETTLDRQTETGTSLSTSTDALTPSPGKTAGFPDLESAEYEWVSADLLEMIWRGNHVPLEAVQAPAKTLMPRVGNVRVFTTSGDVFDGRLYAVGQNRVWVDAEPGRIGLDGDRVEKIEVLGPAPEGVQTSTQDAAPAGKKRVRVRAPGGMLYGSVLKAEGEEVLLALDDGGRVRVKAGDIQDLGPGRAVVVRR